MRTTGLCYTRRSMPHMRSAPMLPSGLAEELLPSPGVGLAERALLDGAVDVLWAGPMRVMKHHDENPTRRSSASQRSSPRSVLDRRPIPQSGSPALRPCQNAPCHRLRGANTVAMSAGGSVAGIDPARLDRITDRSMAENLNALSEGRLEAAQFFEPVVEEALASGRVTCGTRRAHVAVPLARFRNTRDRFVRDAEPLLSMVRAIQRTQQWIYSRSAPEIAETISSFFPALDRGVLAAALARYQAQSVWGRDPVLPENGFDCLRRYLVSGGFIRRPTRTQPASTIASPCKS